MPGSGKLVLAEKLDHPSLASCSRSRTREITISARRTTTGPVETQRGGRGVRRHTQPQEHVRIDHTHKGGGGRECPGGEGEGPSRTLRARTYRGYSATLAPGPLPVRLTWSTALPCKRQRRASGTAPSLWTRGPVVPLRSGRVG